MDLNAELAGMLSILYEMEFAFYYLTLMVDSRRTLFISVSHARAHLMSHFLWSSCTVHVLLEHVLLQSQELGLWIILQNEKFSFTFMFVRGSYNLFLLLTVSPQWHHVLPNFPTNRFSSNLLLFYLHPSRVVKWILYFFLQHYNYSGPVIHWT